MVVQEDGKIKIMPDNLPMITCSKCGKQFPVRRKSDWEPGVLCDACLAKSKPKKLIGGPLDGQIVIEADD